MQILDIQTTYKCINKYINNAKNKQLKYCTNEQITII